MKPDQDLADILGKEVEIPTVEVEKSKKPQQIQQSVASPVTEEKKSMSKTVDIAGVSMPILPVPEAKHAAHVPSINNAYKFGSHVAEIAMDLLDNKRIMLTGHCGVGKSSIFEQIAARTNQPMVRPAVGGRLSYNDLVGQWVLKGGETFFLEGFLIQACKYGYWLVIDEWDLVSPDQLSPLNRLVEEGGKLVVLETGEVINPHPNFRIIATANTVGVMSVYRALYQGARIQNEAQLDRWRVHYVDYLPEKDEVEVLINTFPALRGGKEELAIRLVRIATMIRDAFKNEQVNCTFSMRRLIDWMYQIMRHKSSAGAPLQRVLKAAENTIFSKVTPEDREAITQIIKQVLGKD